MSKNTRHILTKIIYIFCVGLLIFLLQKSVASFPAVRQFYLFTVYPALGNVCRILTGWCPFSIGDVLYVLAFAWLLIGFFQFITMLVRWKRDKTAWLRQALRFVLIVTSAYGIFLFLWGLNYRYDRLQADFGIHENNFSLTELVSLCNTLASRTNHAHHLLTGNDSVPTQHFLTFREIKKKVPDYYLHAASKFQGLDYVNPSLKPSMFGYMMNYAGITGYFNPFTGEGQVNTTPIPVGLPFTACHEVAHQLGFAKEDDANFIGYLVAASAPDVHFRYAANFEMFLYGINVLSFNHPALADSLWGRLLTPGVRKDYEADFEFYERFKTSVRPVINDFYDQYLKANEQIKGIKSYNQVVALLIDYVRKKGELPE